MKFFIMALVAAVIAGCAITIERQQITKSRYRSPYKTSVTPAPKIHPRVLVGEEYETTVNNDWMKEYRSLEKKHGSISEDSSIYQEGENWKVPRPVADHYARMKLSINPHKDE